MTADVDLFPQHSPNDRQLTTSQEVQKVGAIDEERRRARSSNRGVEEPESTVGAAVTAHTVPTQLLSFEKRPCWHMNRNAPGLECVFFVT